MLPLDQLRAHFANFLQENVSLAGYCTAHTGGAAAAMVMVSDSGQLEDAVQFLWHHSIPFITLGNGSNVLFSDSGLESVVLLNRAKAIRIDDTSETPFVWAESGANLGTVARQAALHGLAGLEWASTIPGTLGGAVYGNAGAFGSDMSKTLVMAEILHRSLGKVSWTAGQMEYAYRSSILKRQPGEAVILSATLSVSRGNTAEIQAKMAELSEKRRRSQPPGASMGSMFKNPAGDYAGRLIEAAGLKGTKIGGAEISPVHGNFFINDGTASASDIHRLIVLVQKTVHEEFGIDLELEVEPLGSWQEE
ncbi:MAG: UDP-N-acetylmuramate dehydrogenase [Anaerolineaceae bacterium]